MNLALAVHDDPQNAVSHRQLVGIYRSTNHGLHCVMVNGSLLLRLTFNTPNDMTAAPEGARRLHECPAAQC